MTGIKPIETIYNGYRFRSRLEARWAVFFDVMGIQYKYEHEGFERQFYENEPRIRYLPDFYFPEWGIFGEVKGASTRGEIPKEDAIKMSWMIDWNGPCSKGIVLLGDIPNPKNAISMEWAVWQWTGKGLAYGYSNSPDMGGVSWDTLYIDYMEAPHYFNKNDDLVLTSATYLDGTWDLSDPNDFATLVGIAETREIFPVEKALLAARQARFEYGETPNANNSNFQNKNWFKDHEKGFRRWKEGTGKISEEGFQKWKTDRKKRKTERLF